MPENKTKETKVSVSAYLKAIEDKEKRDDSLKVIDLMRSVSGFEPKMWGRVSSVLDPIITNTKVAAKAICHS